MASYPWKPCKERMKDNRSQVEIIQKIIKMSMHQDGMFGAYQEEMEKAFASGAVRELTAEEFQEWRGPVHFLILFSVNKASSVSTKLRIVSNSALVNAASGLSLNDCCWAGPNAMAELLAMLIHWQWTWPSSRTLSSPTMSSGLGMTSSTCGSSSIERRPLSPGGYAGTPEPRLVTSPPASSLRWSRGGRQSLEWSWTRGCPADPGQQLHG